LFLIALGNISLLARADKLQQAEPWLIALTGSSSDMLRGGDTSSVIGKNLLIHALAINNCDFSLVAVTDGVHEPLEARFLAKPHSAIEVMAQAKSALASWALYVSKLIEQQGSDLSLSLVSSLPHDDATVLVSQWSSRSVSR